MEKLTKNNQSVEKTLRIIETLARAPEPLRLSQVAEGVDMPLSTVLRMLTTLIDCGYAYQEDSEMKRYGLTMRFTLIGQMVADHFSIRNVAHAYLQKLSQQCGESCCLAIEDNQRVRYLDVVEASKSLITIRQRVGGSAPMHCTGSGKLFLSRYPEAELAEFIQKHGLASLTSHTLTTAEELRYDMETVRKNGYAVDDEECEIGVRCLAAPVYDSIGQMIATVSVSGPISRMNRRRLDVELAPLICATAQAITNVVSGNAKDLLEQAD